MTAGRSPATPAADRRVIPDLRAPRHCTACDETVRIYTLPTEDDVQAAVDSINVDY